MIPFLAATRGPHLRKATLSNVCRRKRRKKNVVFYTGAVYRTGANFCDTLKKNPGRLLGRQDRPQDKEPARNGAGREGRRAPQAPQQQPLPSLCLRFLRPGGGRGRTGDRGRRRGEFAMGSHGWVRHRRVYLGLRGLARRNVRALASGGGSGAGADRSKRCLRGREM